MNWKTQIIQSRHFIHILTWTTILRFKSTEVSISGNAKKACPYGWLVGLVTKFLTYWRTKPAENQLFSVELWSRIHSKKRSCFYRLPLFQGPPASGTGSWWWEVNPTCLPSIASAFSFPEASPSPKAIISNFLENSMLSRERLHAPSSLFSPSAKLSVQRPWGDFWAARLTPTSPSQTCFECCGQTCRLTFEILFLQSQLQIYFAWQ